MFYQRALLHVCLLRAIVIYVTAAQAVNKTQTAAVSGDLGAPANWTGSMRGVGDTATYNTASAHTVTFDNRL